MCGDAETYRRLLDKFMRLFPALEGEALDEERDHVILKELALQVLVNLLCGDGTTYSGMLDEFVRLFREKTRIKEVEIKNLFRGLSMCLEIGFSS